MTLDELLETVHGFDGVLDLAPAEGSETPEIAWGDHFFYYAPDGRVPPGQPYATVVTKDYPGEPASGLGGGRWRVNIHVGRAQVPASDRVNQEDITRADVVLPHPVYARQGWIAVINPGPATTATVLELLRAAHSEAAARRAHHDPDDAG